MVKVLFVAGEAAPFAKTGGLGDVIASLPKELRNQGLDARVIIPKYSDISEEYKRKLLPETVVQVPVSWRLQYCGVEKLEHDGVPFYFIDNEYYFRRAGFYGHYDDAERYAFFCRAVLEVLPHIDFQPHVLHCHDWHSGMVSVFLQAHYRGNPFYERMKTIFTIHNLKYQGVFPKDILINLLDLNWDYFTVNGIEFYDQINFMKSSITFSDLVTTVSPSYANEIQHSYFGEKLEGVLANRHNDLSGIINGIDYDIYNPATDPNLFINYDGKTAKRKNKNKLELQKMLGLPPDINKPLLAMCTRLVEGKGIDLVLRVLNEILDGDVQMVILGQGDEDYHHTLWQASWIHHNNLSVIIPYRESLSRKVFAAADLLLMPSRYEPCGLGQLIAMRYGALPIVHETGGLKDTIQSYNEFSGEGNGFSFTNYNAHDMLYTIRRALIFYHDKQLWQKLVQRVMRADNSWTNSAKKYRQLYHSLFMEEHVYKAATATPKISVPPDLDKFDPDYTQFVPAKESLYAH